MHYLYIGIRVLKILISTKAYIKYAKIKIKIEKSKAMETIEFSYISDSQTENFEGELENIKESIILTEGEYSLVPQIHFPIELHGEVGGKEAVVFLPLVEKYYHLFEG